MVCTRLLSSPQRSATAAKPAAMECGVGHVDADADGVRSARPRSASTAASRAALFLAITATLAPSAARVSAIAKPMPLLPPVTTAFDPAKPRSIVLLDCQFGVSPVAHERLIGATPSPRKQKRSDVLAHVGALAITRRPLPFGARPHHTLNGLRLGQRIDVVKHALLETALELFDERLRASRRRPVESARATRTSATAPRATGWRRSDLMCSSNARSSRPSIQAATASTGVGGGGHFPFSAVASRPAPSPGRPPTPAASFESKCR